MGPSVDGLSKQESMPVIEVEFQRPWDGGTWCVIATNQSRLETSASYVPHDSIGDLAAALALVLKGGPEAVVSWNEEPAEYEFRFQGRGGEVRLDVVRHAGHGRTGRGGHPVLAVEGGRLEVCRPFWRALRRLEGLIPPDEYEAAWGHPFPHEKVSEVGQLLQGGGSAR
jgi:hypothetical protein